MEINKEESQGQYQKHQYRQMHQPINKNSKEIPKKASFDAENDTIWDAMSMALDRFLD